MPTSPVLPVAVSLPADSVNWTKVLTTGPTRTSVYNIDFCNRNAIIANVWLAWSGPTSTAVTGSAPLDAEVKEAGMAIEAKGFHERMGVALPPGSIVWAKSDTALVNVGVTGMEF